MSVARFILSAGSILSLSKDGQNACFDKLNMELGDMPTPSVTLSEAKSLALA